MKTATLKAFLMTSLALAPAFGTAEGAEAEKFDPSRYPKRLKRAESFLGIHFDFHAGEDCTEIGKNTTRGMVEAILDQVKPDYIQVDCKGHRGLCSYPTTVGHPAPGFVGDPLRVWRQVTAERGVSLFMHYSGVWDTEAIKQHPDWARLGPDGKADGKNTSVFGPYADQLLIPQLKELRSVYGVDGVWIDGECWAVDRDYSPAALKAFQESTGFTDVPQKAGDPHWFEFSQFNREAFRRYVRHYVSELHRFDPDFQIASNWLFSEHMPEPVSVEVDFLSGDYSPMNSVNAARFSARCLAPQGKPWDLMAWAFAGKHSDPVRSYKTIPQLQREAAVVLAQGGGFQAYFSQKRDGSIRDWTMPLMAGTAKFCRERQAICHHSEAVPQVALLYSTEGHYRQSGALFLPNSAGLNSLKGVLNNLLDAQYSVDIRSEHHLRGRMKDYPLIVVPQWDYLDTEFRTELLNYVVDGGSLMLVGPTISGLFAGDLSVEMVDQAPVIRPGYLARDGWLGGYHTYWQRVKPVGPSRGFGQIHEADDFKSQAWPAATITPLGKGRIAAVWIALGENYNGRRTAAGRDFLTALTRELFPKPIVEVHGSRNVDVSLQRKGRCLLVNLLNTSGPHADESVITIGEVEAVGPLELTLRLPQKPKRLTLEPGSRKLDWHFRNGEARFRIPRLDIHQVVVAE
jgi:hypothetical protein